MTMKNPPTVRQLFFKPYRPDRIYYTWEWSGTLQGPWLTVTGDPPDPLPCGETKGTDKDAVQPRKFYRLKIE